MRRGGERGPRGPTYRRWYGEGAVHALPLVAAERGWERVLLVHGRRSFETSGASGVLPDLKKEADVASFRDFEPNPSSSDLQRGLLVARSFQPSAIVGIGGGSAMDMAKLLCAFDCREEDLSASIRRGEPVERRSRALVLAPTTSGSGSEATRFAVVYVEGRKYSVEGPALLPDVVLLDPVLALAASPRQRAISGLDAIAQAIESLWAVAADARSRRLARRALGLLLPAIVPFSLEAQPAAGRAMCIGSHLSGRAIDISKTTAAHAFSYAITKGHGTSHGHAVGLTLGPLIETHAGAGEEELRPGVDPGAHRMAMREILARLGARSGAEARLRFDGLMERLGLSPALSDAGVTSHEQRALIAGSVNAQRLGNNPVAFDRQGLEALLEKAG